MNKIETHRYEHHGEQTVTVAAQLIGNLPNGWILKSLVYTREYGVGSWIAHVQGPSEELTESP